MKSDTFSLFYLHRLHGPTLRYFITDVLFHPLELGMQPEQNSQFYRPMCHSQIPLLLCIYFL